MRRSTSILRTASLAIALGTTLTTPTASLAQNRLHINRSTIVQGDTDWDWTQARTAYVPGDSPLCLTTMSRTAKVGVHGYHDVYLSISRGKRKGQNNKVILAKITASLGAADK